MDNKEPRVLDLLASRERAGRSNSGEPVATGEPTLGQIAEAFLAGAPPPFSETDSALWVEAGEQLISAGELAAARRLAHHLREGDPQLKWAATMCKIFAMAPHPDPGATRFWDDGLREVQILPKPGASLVVLAFCGASHRLGLPLNLLQCWLGQAQGHVIYLRDFRTIGFMAGIPSLGPDFDSTIKALSGIITDLGARRVVCLGNSVGAYGALLYGLALGAETVVSLAGAGNLEPEFAEPLGHGSVARRIRAAFPSASLDLAQIYAKAPDPPRVLLVYGQYSWTDRLQAGAFARLPCAEVHEVSAFKGHGVVTQLAVRGELDWVLKRLLSGAEQAGSATQALHAGPPVEADTHPFRPWDPDPDETVVARLASMLALHADKLAVWDAAGGLTFRELAALSDRVAAAVAAVGSEQDGPVAMIMPNDARLFAALLGILKAGRAVLPLDPSHPTARNRLIAAHARPAGVVCTRTKDASRLFGKSVRSILMDQLPPHADGPPARAPRPGDVAYVLYTSGSTGTPKGVYQDHAGLLRDVARSVNSLRLGPADRSALFYPPAVAAGLRICLGALCSGGSLHVLSPSGLGSDALARDLQTQRITVVRGSAALFRRVANALGPDQRLESLRLASLGGDRVDWADFELFRRVAPAGASFCTHLGATECSIYAEWIVDAAVREDGRPLPVGRPFPDREVRLEDQVGVPAAPGEVGEVVVSGRGLALGYWREPQLTAQTFSSDPVDPAMRTYRTGDLARLRPDGMLEFAGRKDRQIKVRGYRVEIGEIENALRTCPGVRDAAVLATGGAGGAPSALVAYAERQPDAADLAPRHVIAALASRVPAHMIPSRVVMVTSLPWLANFKIDLAKLEALEAQAEPARLALDDDAGVQAVISAFEHILKVEGATPEDSVLSLGGDSLDTVNLALELGARLGRRIRPSAIREDQTIAELAELFGQRSFPPTAGRSHRIGAS